MSLRVSLENTSWPTGMEPASKRTMNAGRVPGGMNDVARNAIAVTWAIDWAISVPGWKYSLSIAIPWMDALSMCSMPLM